MTVIEQHLPLLSPATTGEQLDAVWKEVEGLPDPTHHRTTLAVANLISTHPNTNAETLHNITLLYGNPTVLPAVPTLENIANHPHTAAETLYKLIHNYHNDVGLAVLLSHGWNKVEPLLRAKRTTR